MKKEKIHRRISALMEPTRLIVYTLAGFMIFSIAQISSAHNETLGYSTTPTFASVTISNVLVNGGAITSPVEPGSTINVTLDYHIFDDGCPTCIDQIQVGFTHLPPSGCVYDGVPGPSPGVSGAAGFTITAPTVPGTYHLGFDRSQAFSCPAGWWNGAPTTPNRWFAAINVVGDSDSDGIFDNTDNCTLIANTDQRDTDGDGYGNICDPDFDNNGFVNAADLAYLKANFFSTDPDADLDGSGFVNAADLAIIKQMFFGSPGPRGIVP